MEPRGRRRQLVLPPDGPLARVRAARTPGAPGPGPSLTAKRSCRRAAAERARSVAALGFLCATPCPRRGRARWRPGTRRRCGPGDVPSLGAGRGAFPVNRPPGGDVGGCLYDCGEGSAAPFWRRRASSLSRPRDLASWSCERRRSARGFVGAAVISWWWAAPLSSPSVLGSPCPAFPVGRSGSCGAAKQASKIANESEAGAPVPLLLISGCSRCAVVC